MKTGNGDDRSGKFATTRWTVVLAARDPKGPAGGGR